MSERAIQNGYLIAAQSDIENLRARITALEAVVRAADRMEKMAESAFWKLHGQSELADSIDDYRSARAALGEIGGE